MTNLIPDEHSRRQSKDEYTFHSKEPVPSAHRKVVLDTLVGKKTRMFFYSSRQVFLYDDGSFAYSRRKKKEIKRLITTQEIQRVERNKQILTISTFITDVSKEFTFSFKFSS